MKNPTVAAECESRQLVSDLFHQLSQPLTTLCCSLELALLQTPSAEQYSEVVAHVLGQAEKVSALATAIRELIEAGQAGYGGEVLELRRVVEDAVADLLPTAESAGVQVDCNPGTACRVWFDAPRLRHALSPDGVCDRLRRLREALPRARLREGTHDRTEQACHDQQPG
jgi:signal transduction histidine kinase